ncbi:MAG: hypothetical protein OEY88_04825 [Candidatus Bathyarchaeota archaeon]|nr:hypothetical protein [Candidatus Bathyarchaeota archaeon]
MLINKMLIELNYVFFSLILVIYSAWHYFRKRNRHLLYFTLSLTFLALSATFQMLSSTLIHLGIYLHVTVSRLLELGGLALFACFTIGAIIALKRT